MKMTSMFAAVFGLALSASPALAGGVPPMPEAISSQTNICQAIADCAKPIPKENKKPWKQRWVYREINRMIDAKIAELPKDKRLSQADFDAIVASVMEQLPPTPSVPPGLTEEKVARMIRDQLKGLAPKTVVVNNNYGRGVNLGVGGAFTLLGETRHKSPFTAQSAIAQLQLRIGPRAEIVVEGGWAPFGVQSSMARLAGAWFFEKRTSGLELGIMGHWHRIKGNMAADQFVVLTPGIVLRHDWEHVAARANFSLLVGSSGFFRGDNRPTVGAMVSVTTAVKLWK